MELEQLIDLIRATWPHRYTRGRVTHVHRNALELADGSKVHLRVMIQTLTDAPPAANEIDVLKVLGLN